MNTEKVEVDIDVLPDVEVAEVKAEVADDVLASVPEKVRGHVEAEKYVNDADYKRAIDNGWKPKDVFVEGGGDESDWTGYKAFNRSYDGIKSTREMRKELAEMKRNTDAILNGFNEEKERYARQLLAEKETQLATAKADGDVERALEIQKEMLNTTRQQVAPQQAEPLPVLNIRRKHSFLNTTSPDFNPEVNAEFESQCIAMAKRAYNTYGRQLSDLEIKFIADEALDMVKDKVTTKPAMVAKAPATAKPAASVTGQSRPKLSSLQKQTYDAIKERNGAAAAEAYLKMKTQ